MQTQLDIAVKTSGIKLTPRAHFLMSFILESVSEEKAWSQREFDGNTPGFLQDRIVEKLPSLLSSLQEKVGTEVVTFFDVMHYFEELTQQFFPRNMFFPGKL